MFNRKTQIVKYQPTYKADPEQQQPSEFKTAVKTGFAWSFGIGLGYWLGEFTARFVRFMFVLAALAGIGLAVGLMVAIGKWLQ
jgi:apolipoprotein N-acyltransferase